MTDLQTIQAAKAVRGCHYLIWYSKKGYGNFSKLHTKKEEAPTLRRLVILPDYQVAPTKWGAGWGQRHTHEANSGSNGTLKSSGPRVLGEKTPQQAAD